MALGRDEDGLTEVERLFVSAYCGCLNQSEAYHRVKPDVDRGTAGTQGSLLMARPHVAKAVRDKLEQKRLAFELDPMVTLHNVQTMANSDPTWFLDEFGNVDIMAIKNAPPELRRTIESIEVSYDKLGNRNIKVKLHSALKANELIGKNQKLWTEKFEMTGKDGGDMKITVEFKDPV